MAPKASVVHQDGVAEVVVEPKRPQLHPLLSKPVPHAYALIPCEGRPGLFYAVHLSRVQAEKLDHLEPNSRPLAATFGMLRIAAAMEKRHQQKLWSK